MEISDDDFVTYGLDKIEMEIVSAQGQRGFGSNPTGNLPAPATHKITHQSDLPEQA
jgi:hypothetical protein